MKITFESGLERNIKLFYLLDRMNWCI